MVERRIRGMYQVHTPFGLKRTQKTLESIAGNLQHNHQKNDAVLGYFQEEIEEMQAIIIEAVQFKHADKGKPSVVPTSKKPSANDNSKAHNVNAQINLNKKMRALQKAQNQAVKMKQLPDSRIRYYSKEIKSKTQGATRGASHV